MFDQQDPFRDFGIMNHRERLRNIDRNRSRVIGFGLFATAVGTLLSLGVTAAIIYVAYHFVSKWW